MMRNLEQVPKSSDESSEHDFLRSHRIQSSVIGISHTFLCAGVVFGWASLLPVFRTERDYLSPIAYAAIFNAGAIGNYTSNLPFGFLLDKKGPKTCGVVASVLFALALILCSLGTSQYYQSIINDSGVMLGIGYALLGFAGPGIQIPTLHLAKLFDSKEGEEGSSGGDATYMSAQAAAFDGGTAIFALFAYSSEFFGLKASQLFLFYLIVPIYTLLTSSMIWPNEILPDIENDSNLKISSSTNSFGGSGSPFLSEQSVKRIAKHRNKRKSLKPQSHKSPLKDAPLSTVLSQSSFYCLAMWVSMHILKLNFVVASINDQLLHTFHEEVMSSSDSSVTSLINVFGSMLPFGFILMPLTAFLLQTNPMLAFQVANMFGVLYGAILSFAPDNTLLLSCVAFPLVATSRQLVYSTVFHQIGAIFGFANFGVLLGLTNVIVSLCSLAQGPLVKWAESSQSAYFGPNLVLLLFTFPLFIVILWIDKNTTSPDECQEENSGNNATDIKNKKLLMPRTISVESYDSMDPVLVPLNARGKIHSFTATSIII